MSDTVFLLLHLPVFPAWALLILAPSRHWTDRLVHSGLVPVLLGVVYGALLFAGAFLGQSAPDAGMASLPAVMALFSHPVGVLTGWTHFLVFDHFVGAWVAWDARGLGLGHCGTVHILILCLVFAPLGLMAHLLRRVATGNGWYLR